MFNAAELLIDAFVERLEAAYRRNYGNLEPAYPELLSWAGRMAMERIANSDALYHDAEHTMMVTLVGQERRLSFCRLPGLFAGFFHFFSRKQCVDSFAL